MKSSITTNDTQKGLSAKRIPPESGMAFEKQIMNS